jgi:hypothetical protein
MIYIVLGWLALFVTVAIGWVMNVFDIIATVGFSGLLVLRVVGLFLPPLGAFLGYFY